jgi:hypothetical protein
MLPAPATPIGLSAFMSHSIQCAGDFVADFYEACCVARAL